MWVQDGIRSKWVVKSGINPDCENVPVFYDPAPGKTKIVCSCGFKIRSENHTKGPHHKGEVRKP